MSYMPAVFSLMFFSAFLVYVFWGIHLMKLDSSKSINRVCMLICVLLAIWSFGFAIANTAKDISTALYWRRFSAVGWTCFYSAFFHFILLLTHRNTKIKHRRLFVLVYLPGLINMYIFALSDKLVQMQYNLIKIDFGWTNISVNNIYDWFFNLYYISFLLCSLILIWRWKQKLQEVTVSRQANLIISGIIFVFIAGSFTDILANSFLENPMPQLSCILILFPMGALYHSAIHYDLLNPQAFRKEEIIASEDQKKYIFIILSIALFIGGFVAFSAEYFPTIDNSKNLITAILKAMSLISIGLILFFTQRIRKEYIKEALTIIVLLLSIPIVTFQFLEYSAITIWVYPVTIIISSLLFTKRSLLIMSTVVAILTQRLIWILKPEAYILVDKYDYILRIMVFIVVYLLGSYVNKIYVAKIKENSYQIKFQKMNADISLDFISLNHENFSEKIEKLLASAGMFFEAERTYLFIINHKSRTMRYSNEWCKNSVDSIIEDRVEVSVEFFPWWIKQLKMNKPIYIEDIKEMPEEAEVEKKLLLRRNVKSIVLMPIVGKDEIQGFMGVDSITLKKKWSDENIKLLGIIGNLLANGLIKLNSDKEIEFMAYNDNLTKLPNRFSFAEKVNQAINTIEDETKCLSILFIDLDNFKTVNDSIGHSGGDILLKEVAKGLVKSVGESGIVARFGGDEFMILLDNITDYSNVIGITEEIMKSFSSTFTVHGHEFSVTASAGIAFYPQDGQNSEELIKNADIAMYKAKGKGKNQYTLCSKDMKNEVELESILSADLCHALENDELIVYYQPQINLYTNEITGVEALLRWNHPKRGMISPGVFIPLAEKNGLINNIGEWVLRTACIQNKNWQDRGIFHINMAVNISIIQFLNPKIVDNIKNIIKETGINAKYLELEITESIASKENICALDILNNLKKTGVSISIDDFGTEYSSLSRLKMLPIDRIKIDMQFIKGLETNEKDKAITLAIINLAKNLGLDVIAEGVETKHQLEFLKDNMCDHIQGYYYYKPMPAKEIEEILFNLTKETI